MNPDGFTGLVARLVELDGNAPFVSNTLEFTDRLSAQDSLRLFELTANPEDIRDRAHCHGSRV